MLRLRPSARYSHTSFSSVASHGSPLNSGGRLPLALRERCRDERRRGDGHGAIQKSSERKVGECCKTHRVALGVALGFSTERSTLVRTKVLIDKRSKIGGDVDAWQVFVP